MNLEQLIAALEQDGTFRSLALFPFSQFGTEARRYIGAELLPERIVPSNSFTERGLRYRSIIANDGSRHSPAQRKGGAAVGELKVQTENSDIQSVLDSTDYDALLDILRSNDTMEAVATITDWLNAQVNIPLIEVNEKHRWEMLVTGVVQRRGDNTYSHDITYPTPPGLRAAVAAPWSNPAVDPWMDIMAIVSNLRNRGKIITRIIADSPTVNNLSINPKMMSRMGGTVIVNNFGTMEALPNGGGVDRLNAFFGVQGLPAIERYDLQYDTGPGGFKHFLPRGTMVFVTASSIPPVEIRTQVLEGDDIVRVLTNTIGYTAIGRAVGQGTPGRVLRTELFTNKPPRLEGEGWQESVPVLVENDAVGVLTGTNA